VKTLIVIPARYKSKRFEGKPLAIIRDRKGVEKTLIQRTWESAKKIKNIEKLIVSTDDKRIEKVCKSFGADVVITSSSCKNGTERVAQTLKQIKEKFDFVINFQGDSPLTPSDYVYQLLNTMKNTSLEVATPVLEVNQTLLNHIKADEGNSEVGSTSVVFKKNFDALYFSKKLIPFKKLGGPFKRKSLYFHVGLYIYTEKALEKYLCYKEGNLEKIEGLEQLRFLENNLDIKCVLVNRKKYGFWEVNNPGDIKIVEGILASGSL
jgi:3-deoxy-manno-octulosonate cytidylyltransferase (CMP-KDO synthetase)